MCTRGAAGGRTHLGAGLRDGEQVLLAWAASSHLRSGAQQQVVHLGGQVARVDRHIGARHAGAALRAERVLRGRRGRLHALEVDGRGHLQAGRGGQWVVGTWLRCKIALRGSMGAPLHVLCQRQASAP